MTMNTWTWALLSGFGLIGFTPSPAALAADTAAEVGQQSGQAANDASLATDLKSNLADRVPDAAGIDVGAHNGIVTLSGTVSSQAAQRRAVALAWATPGVTRVDDQLTVQGAR